MPDISTMKWPIFYQFEPTALVLPYSLARPRIPFNNSLMFKTSKMNTDAKTAGSSKKFKRPHLYFHLVN
jgi:hypothetical protein